MLMAALRHPPFTTKATEVQRSTVMMSELLPIFLLEADTPRVNVSYLFTI